MINAPFRASFLTVSLIVSVFIAETAAQQDEFTTIQPDNSDIQYTGRWNFENPREPWVVWQGSSISVALRGTAVKVDLDPGTRTKQYRVIIDGKPNSERLYVEPGRKEYTLAENLPLGEHTVELFKETFTGEKTTLYALSISGTLLDPPSRPTLRIEWFGDSNMDGTALYSEKNTGDNGTYYAYPAMVTRMLGAEMNIEALGGATLDGKNPNRVRNFIFSQDFKNLEPAYRRNFDPHIIVVNAGANDINRADEATIRQRYKDVVSDLRTVYGDVPHLVLMNSYGWDVKEPANYSKEVGAEIGGNLSVFHFPWLWEKWHGSQWDHSGQAHLLVDHLAAINPDWKQVNAADIVDGFGRNGDFANGSFEHTAPFGAYGWRYMDDGVERIHDPASAPDGEYYIRLDQDEMVHQPTDATADFLRGGTEGGETYTLTAKIRARTANAKAQIITEFQGQQIWNRADAQPTTFDLTAEWAEYTKTVIAKPGVWTLFTTLKSSQGTVDFDEVRMTFNTNGK